MSAIKVTLDEFVKIEKLKPHEVAGFRRWIRSGKVRRRAVQEWRDLRTSFMTRTVR